MNFVGNSFYAIHLNPWRSWSDDGNDPTPPTPPSRYPTPPLNKMKTKLL